jgi:prepilin-type N-terminal cleavage/methylation domain-containing protein
MKNLKKGFTLIELLVVVAIIGILASVVLASLNTARAKGSDAAIKANLDNMRAEAAIYYDGTGGQKYSAAATNCSVTNATTPTLTGCTTDMWTDTTMLAGIKGAAASAGGTLWANTSSDGSAYAILAPLKSSTTTYWCVDSIGKSESETTTAPATGVTACP